jgi:flagellar biosynthetic protein FlhB
LSLLIDSPAGFPLTDGSGLAPPLERRLSVGRFLLPAVAVLGVAGIVRRYFRTRRACAERIRPQWSRISPPPLETPLRRPYRIPEVTFVRAIARSAHSPQCEPRSMMNAMFSDPTQIPDAILALAVQLVSGSVSPRSCWLPSTSSGPVAWHRDLRMSRQKLRTR